MLNLSKVYDITNVKFILKINRNNTQRREEIVEKRKIDKRKIATRIMAGILALLMVVGTVGTLVYYVINYVIKK